MARLCERPGCSDPAAVAYGMRPEDLVFWLDVWHEDVSHGTGVLCRRHADSMVVPRGWTLDDLRDPELHLFRPPTASSAVAGGVRSPRRRRASGSSASSGDHTVGEQLAFGAATAGRSLPPPEPGTAIGGDDVESETSRDAATATPAAAWTPDFDADDDLDGLLAARSPLLARAFRGHDRRR